MAEEGRGQVAYRVYVSLAGEDKISIYALDADTGRLALYRDVEVSGAPGPLAVGPSRRFMYAGLRATNELATFAVDPQTGDLSRADGVSTSGLRSDPCYLATDRAGRFLLSAYYHAGLIAVHPIGDDGVVRGPAVEWLVTAPHAHCIQTDPSNRFVDVPHTVPSNRILQFAFDGVEGTLSPVATPRAEVEDGAGPRHYCFHPTRDMVYVSNEQGSSVTTFRLDPSTGDLANVQTLSTLPEGYEGRNAPAQIHIHPTGRFLYASNRGHDSIACFALDEATGRMRSLCQQPTEPSPRAFNLDPSGRYLYAAGQGSGRLAGYSIEEREGTLTPTETISVGENPMWVLPIELPG
jgi:6-phosphogluconolactonase